MRTTSALLACALGCAASVLPEPAPLEATVDIRGPALTDLPPAAPIARLTECLRDGGRLLEVDVVDNNDTTAHGEVRAFDVSVDGQLAAATEDGVIKLWRLDGFVAALTPGMLIYGPELEAPSTDIAFFGSKIVTGDTRGLVSALSVEEGLEVLGGTTPDTPIVAVAVDPVGERVAHADAAEGGNVHLRGRDGVQGPLATGLLTVGDLVFAADGTLFLAGADAEGAARLQRWSPEATLEAEWSGPGPIAEIATAGDRIAAAGGPQLVVLDARLNPLTHVEAPGHDARSVSLSSDGLVVFTVGADDSLRAFDLTGTELAAASVSDPVTVRARGEFVFVAERGGMLRALACE